MHELYSGDLTETRSSPDGAYPREDFVGMGMKPWKHEGGTHLVILETDKRDKNAQGGTDSLGRFLRLALITMSPDSSYKVIAKTSAPIPLDVDNRFNKFDLAPYRYRDDRYAPAVRSCRIDCGTGACNSAETLMLFGIADGHIQSLFSTPIAQETRIIRGEGKNKFTEAKITVDTRKKTHGYFHFMKRLHKKTAMYEWNGEKYTTSDKDPLEFGE